MSQSRADVAVAPEQSPTLSERPPLALRRLARFVAARLRGQPTALRSRPVVEGLEPRVMLSAEFGPGLDPARDTVVNDPLESSADTAGDHSLAFLAAGGDAPAPASFSLDGLGAVLAANDDAAGARREIVFVDAGVDDYSAFIDSLRRNADDSEISVVVLERDRDGIAQMDAVLAGATDIDAVHVISHGSERGVQLGSTWLSDDSLATYAATISGWQDAFNSGADFLFYGCNLAGSTDGRALVDGIADLTGTDVAASIDLTGNVVLGGDWDLEYITGAIGSSIATGAFAAADWSGVLGQITVTTGNDVISGGADLSSLANLALNPGADGLVSLREAVIAANTDIGADVIFLGIDTYRITDLSTNDTGGDFDIRDDLSIVGISPTDTVVDGRNVSSVFDVHDDAAITVTFANLKVTRGDTGSLVTEDGAGLYVYGSTNTPDVYLSNVWFTDNNTSGFNDEGGAIYNEGNLTIENALIDNNESKRGGGIYNAGGASLTLTNVTLSGNSTHSFGGQQGGGLYNAGTATIYNSTITLNDANTSGGGIYHGGTATTIANSIVAGNIAGTNGPDILGTMSSLGDNVIGNTANASGFVGSDALNMDPLLGALADNGGPLMTHALQPGSVAIGLADTLVFTDTDQRGFVRDDGAPDAGAYEADAATDPITATLWLSSAQDVSNGGQPGTDDWDDADLIEIADPFLNLGPGATSGTFAVTFAGNGFDPGWDISAAHYVTRDIQIGASNFQLREGDLLLSAQGGATLASNNLVALESGFAASLTVGGADLVVFRPDTVGDFSRGQFGMLIEDLADPGAGLRGVTLVEQSTVVGGYTLEAGDFLYSRTTPSLDHSLWLYETNTIGAGATPDNRFEFLDGDEAGIAISDAIYGFELIEETTRVGNVVLDAGTILVNVDGADTVGSNGLALGAYDVFVLDVTTASLVGAGQATASPFFQGGHVAFNSMQETIDALTLFTGTVVVPNMDPVAEAGSNQTIAEGDTLAVNGGGSSDADGAIVSYEWDLNNDGSFEKAGVSVTFTWGELASAMIDDDGSYLVGLRVTDDDGAQHTDTFTLTVTNTAPTFAVTGDATVIAGTVFTLDITATEPGDDQITSYWINWGDGTITNPVYTGTTTTVTHTYTDSGFLRSITFAAVDEDGTWTDSDLIVGNYVAGDDTIYLFDGNTGDPDGQFGSSGGAINRAYASIYMPNGDYLVAGFSSNNIARYDSDGNYLGLFVAAGDLDPGPGVVQLDRPSSFAWGPDGNLYVSNFGDDNILRFDAAGNYIDIFGTAGGNLNGPAGLAWGPDGDLYAASWQNGRIVKFDGATGGPASLVVSSGVNSPEQIVFDAAGNLYIANGGNDEVSIWDGVSLSTHFDDPALRFPTGLTLGPDGQLYVSSYTNDMILRYDGVDVTVFADDGPGGLAQPEHLLFSPQHLVTVTDGGAPAFVNAGPFTIDENASNGTVVGDIDANDGDGADPGLDDLLITEIMFDPDSTESDWEWIEIYNGGSEMIDLSGFVLDDNNMLAVSAANIASGTIAAGETAVLYNADAITEADFIAAWGAGINLIAVSEWDDIQLNNTGDTIGLWSSFADYSGDHIAHGNAFFDLTYTAVGPWPVPDAAASIFLVDLDADPSDGSNWSLSAVGLASPHGGSGYRSTAAAGNTGADVGSPGDASASGGVTYSITANVNGDGDGQQAFSIDAATGIITVNDSGDLDFEDTTPLTITVQADDGLRQTTIDVTINLNDLNEQLAATNTTQTQTYTEDAGSVALDDIVITDVDAGEMVTATLTLADISAGVLTTSGGATYTPGTGVWTITDTVANVNTALAAASFTPALNHDQDTTIAVNIADGGENGTVAVTGTITLDVTAVNDQPAATNVTQTRTYTEGDPGVALDDIVITDVDAGETVTAILTLADTSAGVLTTSGGATYTAGTGVWTITDTVANVNAALAAVSFTPAVNNDQDTTIAVNIADGGENGTVAVTGTITLDVTAVNDQPAATNVTQTQTYNEGDLSVAIDDIVVTDVDTGETVTATLTLANPLTGVLTTLGGATYTVGTGVWTITDTVANVNAALAAVSFAPLVTNDQDTTIGVSITDGGEGGTVAVTGTITLDVTPINTQPGATNTTQTQTYIEGAGSVALDDIVVVDPDAGEIITANLTLADPNAGSLTVSGGAAFNPASGAWTITDTVANVNAALAAVSFSPAASYDRDTTIAVSIRDGGEFATTPVTGSITLDVTPVNEQPTATNLTQARTYTEDTIAAFDPIVITDNDYLESVTASLRLSSPTVGVLTTSGIATFDSGTGEWRASGSVANVNAALALVSFNPVANYDENVTVTVVISDGGEDGATALNGSIGLSAIAVGDTPLVANATTAENTPSEPIVVTRNPNDGAEVTHYRISGITHGRLTLADGTTPVNDGDYIPVAAGQAGLRFIPDPDQVATGRFMVEASEDGLTVAAQSAKAQATITVTPQLTEEEELAGTAGAFASENAAGAEPVSTTPEPEADPGNEPTDTASADDPAGDEANLLAAAAADAGTIASDRAAPPDDALVSTLGTNVGDGVDDSSGPLELRDKSTAGTSQTGFVERFMFSATAGLIRTDSYVDADLALIDSDGGSRAYEALLSDVAFLEELDAVREDLNDVAALGQTFVGSSVALSTGISVGYVVWIARGGLLLASLVSSMPAWRLVDPLPILARLEDPDAAAGEGDSLASIIERTDDGPAVVEHAVDPASTEVSAR